jgi:putative endonuclease
LNSSILNQSIAWLPRDSLGQWRVMEYTHAEMSSGRIPELITAALERVARLFRRTRNGPAHLHTGRKGEDMAYYFLRRQGYTIIARNWRCKGRKGEVDLIGWDRKILCFIEVKTRRSHAVATAEAAVDHAKQVELRGMVSVFLRRQSPRPQSRFDVVSIYLIPGMEPEIELFKDAFSWRSMSGKRRL